MVRTLVLDLLGAGRAAPELACGAGVGCADAVVDAVAVSTKRPWGRAYRRDGTKSIRGGAGDWRIIGALVRLKRPPLVAKELGLAKYTTVGMVLTRLEHQLDVRLFVRPGPGCWRRGQFDWLPRWTDKNAAPALRLGVSVDKRLRGRAIEECGSVYPYRGI